MLPVDDDRVGHGIIIGTIFGALMWVGIITLVWWLA